MRSLAIDLGARRIGLALSDTGGKWATPHDVLFVTNPSQAIAPILKLIEAEDVTRLIVGLPLNMNGIMGSAARGTITWAKGLAASAAGAGLSVQLLFVDERLTSFDAEQKLAHRKRAGEKLTQKRKRKMQDAIAAAGFLQAFLDEKLAPVNVSG